MVTQQVAIEQVKEFTKEVKALGLHLRRLILYGSHARNQQREYSKIDVAM